MSRRFSDTSTAKAIINEINAGGYSNRLTIIGLLKQIINDLPNTPIAKEAESMLCRYE